MIAAAAGCGASAALFVLLIVSRPSPPRRSLAPSAPPPPGQRRLDRLGRLVGARIGLADDPSRGAALGRAVALAVPLAVVAPALAALVLGGTWAQRWAAVRRRRHDHVDAVRRALPDVVDLLRLCTTGGLSLPLAHTAVAPRASGPVGPALLAADRAVAAGASRADALVTHLRPLGDRAANLAQVLADHLRYGAPLAPALDRLALELRLDRRRHAEQAARRVPVKLLAPLVLCTLPAFALLTVVPLLGASLQGLPV